MVEKLKILFCASKYDYGDPTRGPSFETESFHPPLSRFGDIVEFDFPTEFKKLGRQGMNDALLETVRSEKPDIFFCVLTRDEIDPETLRKIKAMDKTISIHWFCDDQWRFEGFSSVYAPCFDFVVTTDKLAMRKYKDIGVEGAILSQWACVSADSLKTAETYSNVNLKFDITFVGQWHPYRQWIVNLLAKARIPVKCFGHGWPEGRVTKSGMEDIFRQSRINLNLSNSALPDIRYVLSSPRAFKNFLRDPKKAEQIKARHFEIPAVGGFQLTYYAPFIEDYFRIGEEIQIYASPDDLIEKARFFLKEDALRAKVIEKGAARTFAQHTYSHRFDAIFARLRESGKWNGKAR